jgi:transposase InsO family protein
VLFDRDAKFGDEVLGLLKASGIEPVRTSLRSPWQNGIAERWVGSIRRELMDHVITLNEQQWLSEIVYTTRIVADHMFSEIRSDRRNSSKLAGDECRHGDVALWIRLNTEYRTEV